MTQELNLSALTAPKTPIDILALLREFRAAAARLQQHLDMVGAECEASELV